jgi:hypothetical protein
MQLIPMNNIIINIINNTIIIMLGTPFGSYRTTIFYGP